METQHKALLDATDFLLKKCEGARAKDGAGFSKFDAEEAKRLRRLIEYGDTSVGNYHKLHHILWKYRIQLKLHKIDYYKIPEPLPTITATENADKIMIFVGKHRGKSLANVCSVDPQYIVWLSEESMGNPYLKAMAKNIIEGKPCPLRKAEQSNSVKLSIIEGWKIRVETPYSMKDRVKELSEREWNSEAKAWESPVSILSEILEKFKDEKIEMTDEVCAEIEKTSVLKAMSGQTTTENLISFGKGLTLMPFQAAGVAFIEKAEGKALLADDCGLGKTVQALAWLRKNQQYRPCIIVSPASVKLNWKREATKWLDPKVDSITILDRKEPLEKNKTIHIINYDILKKNEEYLLSLNAKAIVFDESHALKNEKAQRTKVALALSKTIPHRLLLTGTPILNRPIELFSQIRILNKNIFPNKWRFGYKFCAGHAGFRGVDFSGSSNSEELHEILKGIMVRRKKSEVLKELPTKRRSFMPIGISNYKEYRAAENDFLEWLQVTKGEDAADTAARAPAIAKMTALKRLVGDGKVKAAIEWIDAFLESSDRKIVLFAHHKNVIDKIYEKYTAKKPDFAVKLTGSCSQKQRQESIDKFQNSDATRVFIGNIQAAGVGITLTKASDCAILEYVFTPSLLSQCEDRLHRIGQMGNHVSVTYLFGENTIDSFLTEMLESKSKVIEGVIDGLMTPEFVLGENKTLLDDVLAKFKAKAEERQKGKTNKQPPIN